MKRGVLSALVFVADAPSPRDSDVLFFDTGGSRLRLRLDEPPPAIGHRPSGLKVPLANGSQILTQPLARLNDHLSTLIFNRAKLKYNACLSTGGVNLSKFCRDKSFCLH